MKLETYTTYCVFSSEEAFKYRDIYEEVDERKDATKIARKIGGIVKACVSVNLDNNVDKAAEFGYGDTVAEAKKNLMAWLHKYYGKETYTI